VCFGEAISLADTLGDRREVYRKAAAEDLQLEAEKRDVIEGLGWRIVEQINWSFVANATSVAACAVMGSPHRGIRRVELVEHIHVIVDLLKLQKTRMTKALLADQESFEESIAFLLRNDLLQSRKDPGGEILFFDESRRIALDLYRNSIAHFLATPSFLARRLLTGADGDILRRDLVEWQKLFYQEFYSPEAEVSASHCEAFLEHFVERGWITHNDGIRTTTGAGRPVFEHLAEQTRSVVDVYELACTVAGKLDGVITRADFFAEVTEAFEGASIIGKVTRREAANDTTFSNAVDLLIQRGVLTEHRRDVQDKKGRKGGSKGSDKKGKPPRQERVLAGAEDQEPLKALRAALAVSGSF
jgi:glycerol-3-phosphate O-acyltransferase